MNGPRPDKQHPRPHPGVPRAGSAMNRRDSRPAWPPPWRPAPCPPARRHGSRMPGKKSKPCRAAASAWPCCRPTAKGHGAVAAHAVAGRHLCRRAAATTSRNGCRRARPTASGCARTWRRAGAWAARLARAGMVRTMTSASCGRRGGRPPVLVAAHVTATRAPIARSNAPIAAVTRRVMASAGWRRAAAARLRPRTPPRDPRNP